MEFIDKLKLMGCETYKYTTEKTSKIAKETKMKMKINQNKSNIEDIYVEIGKIVYQQHVREENIDINSDIEMYCKQIDGLSNEIEEINNEILNLKDKKKCEVCAKEIEIECKFCPHCGQKQSEVEAKDAEVVTESKNEDEVKNETAIETQNEDEAKNEIATEDEKSKESNEVSESDATVEE
jgi:hypothetical protein